MSRDAFLRLAFITLCSGYVAGLIVASQWLGWATIAVFFGGLIWAIVLSEDWSQPPKPTATDELNGRRERPSTDSEGRPRGFERLRG